MTKKYIYNSVHDINLQVGVCKLGAGCVSKKKSIHEKASNLTNRPDLFIK